jgi:hypothetical protein
MKRILSVATAVALGIGAVAATAGTASAGGPGWGGPGWGGGPGWHGRPWIPPRHGWRGPPPAAWGPGWGYPRGGYYYYGGGWSPGAAAAVGAIAGLGLGAAIAANNSGGYEVPPPAGVAWDNHVQYCQDRYRSYDVRTDTFVGSNGQLYRCVGTY